MTTWRDEYQAALEEFYEYAEKIQSERFNAITRRLPKWQQQLLFGCTWPVLFCQLHKPHNIDILVECQIFRN
jgi:hypothetical protein